MDEWEGVLGESARMTLSMLDTSKGRPKFHRSSHGGSVGFLFKFYERERESVCLCVYAARRVTF